MKSGLHRELSNVFTSHLAFLNSANALALQCSYLFLIYRSDSFNFLSSLSDVHTW